MAKDWLAGWPEGTLVHYAILGVGLIHAMRSCAKRLCWHSQRGQKTDSAFPDPEYRVDLVLQSQGLGFRMPEIKGLRSIKETLQMGVLRCKTPELVRKELWTHILAYNLIRTIMAQAASKHGLAPRSLSFKGAVQTLEAFQPVIALQVEHDAAFRSIVYEHLLAAVACHRVGDRPNRYEPRLKKRHPNHYGYLRKPRSQAKRDLLKGVSNN
jgi:hypothetical protein